jgi:hypothetical protein
MLLACRAWAKDYSSAVAWQLGCNRMVVTAVATTPGSAHSSNMWHEHSAMYAVSIVFSAATTELHVIAVLLGALPLQLRFQRSLTSVTADIAP